MIAPRAMGLAVALALAGCSTVGDDRLVHLDEPEAARLLVPGRTTQADARRTFGDGTVIRFQSGFETWRYDHREGLAKGWDNVPYVNLIAARLDGPTTELVLLFDPGGVLRRWSLLRYRDHGDQPATP